MRAERCGARWSMCKMRRGLCQCARVAASLVCAQAFNVSHKNYRISELAHWMKHVLRDKKPVEVDVLYTEGPLPRSYQVSTQKFRDAFGYSPPRGIAQSVLKMWQRFEQSECTDFDNPMYYNIVWLKLLTAMQARLVKWGRYFLSREESRIPRFDPLLEDVPVNRRGGAK